MKTGIDYWDEEPIMPQDREYQRLCREAARAGAAEEMEAWQMECAEKDERDDANWRSTRPTGGVSGLPTQRRGI